MESRQVITTESAAWEDKSGVAELHANLPDARHVGDFGQADTNTRLAWIRTRLALERTMMAWNRTSLALIGFGFTVYQFMRKVEEGSDSGVLRAEAPRNFGLAFIVAGVIGTLIALWQRRLVTRYLEGPEFEQVVTSDGMPRASLSVVVTVFLALIGIVTAISVAMDA